MKKLILFVSFVLFASASEVRVSGDSVEFSYIPPNGSKQIVSLSINEKYNVEPGSTICFEEGNGKLEIVEEGKQLTKRSEVNCYQTKAQNDTTILQDIKNMVAKKYAFFLDAEFDKKAGTSRAVDERVIQLNETQKELILYLKEFGQLPAKVIVYDKDFEIIQQYENANSQMLLVSIDTSILEDGHKISIVNGSEVVVREFIVQFN